MVILRGASSPDKVMYDIEMLKLIKVISGAGSNIKILFVAEKMTADNRWVDEVVRSAEYKNVVAVQALGLREVMNFAGK